MSTILGNSKSGTGPVKSNSLNIQTSSNGLPIAKCYGQTRIAPNLFWYGDFAAIKQKNQEGGKGGSDGSASYTYQVAAMMGLCEGPIHGVSAIWVDQSSVTTLAALNMSLYAGTSSQALWGYIETHHPDQALNYPSTAYLAVAPYDLGSSPNLPNHQAEVQGVFWNTGGVNGDADPSLMVVDFLSDPQSGAGFPSANIDTASISVGQSSYRAYCQATGLFLSAALTDQEAARDTLTRWLQLTNSAGFMSGDLLKIVPYGDETVTGNGWTFVPDVTPIYDLDEDDFKFDGTNNPVAASRSAPEDAKNWVKLEILDRVNQYAIDPIEAKDQAQIDLLGPLPADQITAHEICDPAVGAIVAQLILQRSVYIRENYTIVLGWEYCLLEPMDIVTATRKRLGMNKLPIRITGIEEDDQGNLTMTAEGFPAGIATATQYPKQSRTAYQANYAVAPGPVNPPVIFEPDADLLGGSVPQVWVAASGGVNWGGCSVHISVDNQTFTRVGEIELPARLGVLLADIGDVADPDTTSTLTVDISETPGASLVSGTQADADASRTLIYVDGELMAYETATLIGAGQYSLSYLRRGLFGTPTAAHPAGSLFARIDGKQFAYDLPAAYIGSPLWLKFTSINIYGASEEDISAVAAYEYLPDGKGSYIAPPTDVILTSSARTQGDGSHILTVVGSWVPSPGPMLDHHEVRWKTAADATWSGATVPQGMSSFPISPAVENVTYSFQARAVSTAGYPSTWIAAGDEDSGALASEPPSQPSGFTATGAQNANVLAWQANPETDITGYRILSTEGIDATFADAAVVCDSVQATTWTHTNLGYGETRTYWLQALNIVGPSTPAGPATATTSFGVPAEAIAAGTLAKDKLVPSLASAIEAIEPIAQAAVISVAQAGSALAQITQEIETRVSATDALAKSITTFQAVLDQATALVQQSVTAEATARTALAKEVDTLTTTLGDTTASLQVTAESVDGVQAQYTVKTQLDVNGVRYIGGYGLLAAPDGAGGVSIEMGFLVDQFMITLLNPDGSVNNVPPFVVLPSGQVVMQDELVNTIAANKIGVGEITTALITVRPPADGSGGLVVENSAGETILDPTHGIYPGAVTTTVNASGAGVPLSGAETVTAASGVINASGRLAFILVTYATTFSAADHGTNNGVNVSLNVNGVSIFSTTNITGVQGSFVVPWRTSGEYPIDLTFSLRDSEDSVSITCEVDVIDFKA